MWEYPTTLSPSRSGKRIGVKPDQLRHISDSLTTFHRDWHMQKLQGGLQLTFADKGLLSIAPWESKIGLSEEKAP